MSGQPHPLFFYRPGHFIQLFPDHLHEGQVTVSKGRQSDVWLRNTSKPMPQLVAFGTDKRTGKRIKILAAYDGDGANVGRIVADSSWHHYFNINLVKFETPAAQDSASDQIGQFYGNLALWLCPARKRFAMAGVMAQTLARDPHIIEEVGPILTNDETKRQKAGMLAYRLLSSLASPCEIHELVNMTIPELTRYFASSMPITLPDRNNVDAFLPSKESVLGGIIHQYSQELFEQDEPNLSEAAREKIKTAFALGWEDASADQQQRLAQTVKSRERFLSEVERKVSMFSEQNK